MNRSFTELELEAYLDEALSPQEMASVEKTLRSQPALLKRLTAINGRRDAGLHTLGAIWRRHRVSCPTRQQLGGMILGTLSGEHAEFITFHIERVGCRLCRANLEDLQRQQREAQADATTRRQRYFQSSAGYLRPKR
jgi:hypothetical protein